MGISPQFHFASTPLEDYIDAHGLGYHRLGKEKKNVM